MIKKDVEISILLALIKCVAEQVHILKGAHKYDLKRKFNRLLKVAEQYAAEVDKAQEISGDYSINDVYDALMDSLSDAKDVAYKNK